MGSREDLATNSDKKPNWNLTGQIFDVRRFSTHDGEGIRTTAFLKGCPLKCVWCQNPEGISVKQMPLYFENKCIHCGTCVKFSKDAGMQEQEGQIRMNREASEDWELLADVCPAEAIMLDSRTYTVDELIKELLRDRVFFKYGGGVTLSGGEPLMQDEFATEVFKALKKEKVHTAVETSLSVSLDTVKNAVPYIDRIYADLKIYEDENHKKYTGISNERIKKNLRWLLTSEYRDKVMIRTPLIPEYTATEENLSKIAQFLSGLYPEVSYELLNYNPLAEAKYHLVDREYCFEVNPKLYTKEQMSAFGQIAKDNRIKNLILEI